MNVKKVSRKVSRRFARGSTVAGIASTMTVLSAATALAGVGDQYRFPADNLTEVSFPMQVMSQPDKKQMYWANQFTFNNGHTGYIGLQPRPNKANGSPSGIAIFSYFGTGASFTDPHCVYGADGGSGVSCSATFDYEVGHTYLMQVRDAGPGTWEGTALDSDTGARTHIGTWTLPAGAGGIYHWQQRFQENFIGGRDCSTYRYSKVLMGIPSAEGAKYGAKLSGLSRNPICKDMQWSEEIPSQGNVFGSGMKNGSQGSILNEDRGTVLASTPATVDVLGNDLGDGLQLISTGNPLHGTAAIRDNKLVYTPDTGYQGHDLVRYTARDSAGAEYSSFADMAVTVASVKIDASASKQEGRPGRRGTYTIKGTGNPGARVSLEYWTTYASEKHASGGETRVDQDGNWQFTGTLQDMYGRAEYTHTYKVTESNPGGADSTDQIDLVSMS